MKQLISYLLGASMTCTLLAQVEPGAGKWKTWVIPSGSALRLPVPPDDQISATELQWVKECVAQRNQAALANIRYWDAGSPGYRRMLLAEQYVINEGLSTRFRRALLHLLQRQSPMLLLPPGFEVRLQP